MVTASLAYNNASIGVPRQKKPPNFISDDYRLHHGTAQYIIQRHRELLSYFRM